MIPIKHNPQHFKYEGSNIKIVMDGPVGEIYIDGINISSSIVSFQIIKEANEENTIVKLEMVD